MTEPRLTVAYVTAGAAGMYCGSCMRDNTLAAALIRRGVDVHLIPTYTPIRTDEESVAEGKIFYGGINVFLQQKSAIFRWLPRFLDRWLDRPGLINSLASRGIEVDARFLGDMTLSMLKGEHGRQRKEVHRLTDWLQTHVKPDVINFTNVLIAGCVPALKQRLGCPVFVTLQGDDLFLDDLPEPQKSRCFEEIRRIARDVDGFIVFSRYYADFMAEYLGIARERFLITPLGINTRDFQSPPPPRPADRPPTIGYLARLCPAKGFHLATEAFAHLRKMPGTENARLDVAGWLGKGDTPFFEKELARLGERGLLDHFTYHGVIDRPGKTTFLRGVDILSVPTTYREPKGLYVLEAMANGVPVVQPAHGAFPEILAQTKGGVLVPPGDAAALADAWHRLLVHHDDRRLLGESGRAAVLERFNDDAMAEETLAIYRHFVEPTTASRRHAALATT